MPIVASPSMPAGPYRWGAARRTSRGGPTSRAGAAGRCPWSPQATRPADEPVEAALSRALEEVAELKARIAGEPHRYRDAPDGRDFDDIVGQTPALKRLLDQIGQVATTNSAVLVTGETGTGKELVARAVHRRSRRRDKPLVIVNCAALAPTLVEY